MIMRLLLMNGMLVVVRAMFSFMPVPVILTVFFVAVRVAVFVIMPMRMGVPVFMAMLHIVMFMHVFVGVRVLMIVMMTVFMISFHFVASFTRLCIFKFPILLF
jgi:hypothetical protein